MTEYTLYEEKYKQRKILFIKLNKKYIHIMRYNET